MSLRTSLYAMVAGSGRQFLMRDFRALPKALRPRTEVHLAPLSELWDVPDSELLVATDPPGEVSFGLWSRVMFLKTLLRCLPNTQRITRCESGDFEGVVRSLIRQAEITPFDDRTSDAGWARLFVQGPIAESVCREGDDFVVDVRLQDGLSRHAALLPVGGRAAVRFDEGSTAPSAAWVELEGGQRVLPGDPQWQRARNAVTAGMHSKLVVERHLVHTHLLVAGAWATVVQTHLDSDHPLRPLLEPHTVGTLKVNYRAQKVLIGPHGSVVNTYSFTYDGLRELLRRSLGSFELGQLDVLQTLKARGLMPLIEAGRYPYGEDAISLWEAIKSYVERYLDAAYGPKRSVLGDEALKRCFEALAQLMPDPPLGDTHDQIVDAFSGLIFCVTATHQVVGSMAWDFMTVPDSMPHRAYRGVTFDEIVPYREEIEANLVAKWATAYRTYPLLGDWPRLASSAATRDAMQRFQDDLRDVGETVDARNDKRAVPFTYLHPARLSASTAV